MENNLQAISNLFSVSLEEHMAWFGIEPEIINLVIKESYDFEMVKGDIFSQNFDEAAICFIKSGMLHGLREFHGDISACLGFYPPGHIMTTEDTLAYTLDNEPTTIFEAIEDCELSIIPGGTVSKYMKISDLFFKFALDCFTRRSLVLRDWRAVKDIVGKKQFLIISLTGFFDILSQSGAQEIHISIKQLSALTGISRQYLTDILSQLIKEGVIEKKYKNFAPKDLGKLKAKIENQELYSSFLAGRENTNPNSHSRIRHPLLKP